MAKFQSVWAIDIGQAALKALKLLPGETPEVVFAEAFDYIEYPKILSQPDADPEELIQEALQTFLSRNELEGLASGHRRPRPGRSREVHQAAAGREKADPGHRQVRGQAANPVRSRGGHLGLPADLASEGRRGRRRRRLRNGRGRPVRHEARPDSSRDPAAEDGRHRGRPGSDEPDLAVQLRGLRPHVRARRSPTARSCSSTSAPTTPT